MTTNNSWNSENPAQVARGGTGRATLTDGALLLGDGTNAVEQLAMTGKGDLLVGDGTTSPQVLSVGTNDYVLTADSAEVTGLKWAASASSGNAAIVYVSTSTASDSASIDLTGLTENMYLIVLRDILPASSATSRRLIFRVSDDNGSTFETGNYQYVYHYASTDGQGYGTGTAEGEIVVAGRATSSNQAVGNGNPAYGVNGWIQIWNTTNSTRPFNLTSQMTYQANNKNNLVMFDTVGNSTENTTGGSGETTNINAVQLLFNSGNITSGDVLLYKILEA